MDGYVLARPPTFPRVGLTLATRGETPFDGDRPSDTAAWARPKRGDAVVSVGRFPAGGVGFVAFTDDGFITTLRTVRGDLPVAFGSSFRKLE